MMEREEYKDFVRMIKSDPVAWAELCGPVVGARQRELLESIWGNPKPLVRADPIEPSDRAMYRLEMAAALKYSGVAVFRLGPKEQGDD